MIPSLIVLAVAMVTSFLLAATATTLRAQQHHPVSRPPADESSVLGPPMTRVGSGTSWLPDLAPMYASMFRAGRWNLMLHGVAYVQYDQQGSDRGDSQLGSINWGMLGASRALGAGRMELRAMLSLEPWTVSARGYPLLLQSGEAYRGRPLHDRQHPHDLFMELAAVYERPLSKAVALQLYVAPVGEPAVGPVAFPHRPSAADDPFAPLGHHWQDATHISFGVVTAGIFTRHVKVEGSIFNGREPDENRTDFDYGGRRLDSYAGRITVNPSPAWSVSGSYAYLASPEQLHPEQSVRRITGSVLHERMIGHSGRWSSAVIYGGNEHAGATLSNSVLAETSIELDDRNTLFGRAEYVEKSAEELVVEAALHSDLGLPGAGADESDTRFRIGSIALGYVREIAKLAGGTMGLGARGSVAFLPEALRGAYGTRTPAGFAVYLRFRPAAMSMHGAEDRGHGGHEMMQMDHPSSAHRARPRSP